MNIFTLFNDLKTNKDLNLEEESFSFFNDINISNPLNIFSPDNDNLNSFNNSNINSLYIIKNKENNNDSSNLNKINDNKIIKFKIENNPLDKPLKKKIRRGDPSLENSNLKEDKNLKYFKKSKNLNKKKPHTASDGDNILRKIQVQFLSFIICYSNDIITSLIKDKNAPSFKDLDYKIKRVVNHKFVEHLKKQKIGEIVRFKITPKIKKSENINNNVYDWALEKFPIIKEFFDRSYLNLFKEYYKNQNNIFIFNNEIISLSTKTLSKTFISLINKNCRYKEKIKNVSINYYLNTYKKIKKPKFTTHSCSKSNQNKKIK